MRAVVSRSRGLRQTALFALGALAVHQTRYGLALAAGAHEAGGGHRHAYLAELVPALAAATMAAIVVSLLAAAFHRRLVPPGASAGTSERAAAYAAGLIAVYVVQELAEALLAGDAHALAASFGTGGWLIVPLAMIFGAAAALIGRLLDRAEVTLAEAFAAPRPRAPLRLPRPRTVLTRALAAQTLAFGLARRPPPSPALSG
jgi:hypothetical protein